MWTDWWRCYGIPLVFEPLLANVFASSIEDTLEREGKLPSRLLPSIFWWNAHCSSWFDNLGYFSAHLWQRSHFGQIHHGDGKEGQASRHWHQTTQPCTSGWNQGLSETTKHRSTLSLHYTIKAMKTIAVNGTLLDNHAWSRTPIILLMG